MDEWSSFILTFDLLCSGGGLGLHGSPSDYAWGPQGLENVISQMLANLEDDGPPPTKKEKLDSLPVIESTAEELAQCEPDTLMGEPTLWGVWLATPFSLIRYYMIL